MEQKPKWFKFFIEKWRSGTSYLSNAERGAYLELILYQFDKGEIPKRWIDRLCPDEWETISDKFVEVEPGIFVNEMMASIRDDSFKTYNTRLKAFHKESQTDPHTSSISKSKSISKSLSKSKSKSESDSAPLIYPFTDEDFVSAWNIWKDYKMEQHKFTYKPIGEQAALKHIGNLAEGDMKRALGILHQSMNNGWKGLFQLDSRQANTEYQAKAGAWASDILKKHGVL